MCLGKIFPEKEPPAVDLISSGQGSNWVLLGKTGHILVHAMEWKASRVLKELDGVFSRPSSIILEKK